MSTEISDNTGSNAGIILLTGFVGFWYGFSLGIAITQKFSKHKKRYKFLKIVFPACFLFLAFFNIANFVSLENNQFPVTWPTDKENSILLIKQFFTDHPFFYFTAPLSVFVWLISFGSCKNQDVKQTSKLVWFFHITYIIFLLTPAILNETLIGMYTIFQVLSVVGVYNGIKQTSNLSLFALIINYIKKRI